MDETAIKKLLMDLWIAPNLAGYRCLIYAIRLYSGDPGQSFTKEIYPAVGQMCRISGDQVERSIRYAIEAAWLQQPHQGKKPTNGEFISRTAELLAVRKS